MRGKQKHICKTCGQPFNDGKALGGHQRAHRNEPAIRSLEKAGWRCRYRDTHAMVLTR